MDELVISTGGDRLMSMSSLIELHELGGFAIDATIRDGNNTQVVMSEQDVMWWPGRSGHLEDEGFMFARSLGNLFDSVVWSAMADVSYVNSTYRGRLVIEGNAGEEVLLADGAGQYDFGDGFWYVLD
jgi:hypothetical protein